MFKILSLNLSYLHHKKIVQPIEYTDEYMMGFCNNHFYDLLN